MFLRTVTAAFVALAIASGPALACKGEELYSDDFSEKSDFWNADFVVVDKGALHFKLDPGYRGYAFFQSGTLPEFDACVDVKYPAAKEPDGGTYAGFAMSTDKDTVYFIGTTPIGGLFVQREAGGRTLVQIPIKIRPELKAGAGSINTLRLTLKGGVATVYANDKKIGTFKAPTKGASIGLFASMESDGTNDWQFTNFKIAEPPK